MQKAVLDGRYRLRREVEKAGERFGIPESNSEKLRVSLPFFLLLQSAL